MAATGRQTVGGKHADDPATSGKCPANAAQTKSIDCYALIQGSAPINMARSNQMSSNKRRIIICVCVHKIKAADHPAWIMRSIIDDNSRLTQSAWIVHSAVQAIHGGRIANSQHQIVSTNRETRKER